MDLDKLVHNHSKGRRRAAQPIGVSPPAHLSGPAASEVSSSTLSHASAQLSVPHGRTLLTAPGGGPPDGSMLHRSGEPPPPSEPWPAAPPASAASRSKYPVGVVPQYAAPTPRGPDGGHVTHSAQTFSLRQAGPSTSASASRLVCDLCDRAFDTQSTYDSHNAVFHRRSKTPAKPRPPAFECHQCGKGFTSPSKVTVHIEATHLRLRPFKCDLCGKSFGYKGDLTKHKATHTGVKDHTCYICGAKFGRNFYVKRHILTVHEKAGETR